MDRLSITASNPKGKWAVVRSHDKGNFSTTEHDQHAGSLSRILVSHYWEVVRRVGLRTLNPPVGVRICQSLPLSFSR